MTLTLKCLGVPSIYIDELKESTSFVLDFHEKVVENHFKVTFMQLQFQMTLLNQRSIQNLKASSFRISLD